MSRIVDEKRGKGAFQSQGVIAKFTSKSSSWSVGTQNEDRTRSAWVNKTKTEKKLGTKKVYALGAALRAAGCGKERRKKHRDNNV